MKQYRAELLIGIAILAVWGIAWVIAHSIGDTVGELLFELVAVAVAAAFPTLIIGLLMLRANEKAQPRWARIALVFLVIFGLPHFIVSAKLTSAKWSFKLAVAERAADPKNVGSTKIDAALAMRNELLRCSSAYNIGTGWQYDRHTHYLNTGGNLYLWVPFSGFLRKPATTNGSGAGP